MTREVDVVCVGGGLGGLAAAVRAHDLGLEVLVLERSERVGGVAAYSGGWSWVGANHLADGLGLPDDLDAVEAYLDVVQGVERPVDRARRRRYLETAVEATRWFAEAGIPYEVVRGAPDLYHPEAGSSAEGRALECAVDGADLGPWRARLRSSPYYRTGLSRNELRDAPAEPAARLALAERRRDEDRLTHGLGLSAAFVREALVRRGVACETGSRVRRLLVHDGRVTGVVLDGPEGRTAVRTRRGVLLATGGYGHAADAAETEELPSWVDAAPPEVSGDHLELAQDVGGAVVRGADPFVVLGARLDDGRHDDSDVALLHPVLEHVGFPRSMIVNRDGRRFGDESYYGSLIAGLREHDPHRRRWTNVPAWLVVDEGFRRRYPVGPLPPGAAYPEGVASARDLAGLAEAAGIDPDGLVAAVRRHNADAATGVDTLHGRGELAFARLLYGDPDVRPNPNLGPLDEAPFHAIPLHVLGVGLSTMGLAIDEHARVLRRGGAPIPGLYATGNAAATRELKGYVTGLANARNSTYAWAAMTHAAAVGDGTVAGPAAAAAR